jgi:predicted DNA-binding transcriptional regulator AlpA
MNEQTRLTMDEMLWTIQDVADFLQLSVSWVYHAAQKGILPCMRISRNLRFSPRAIRSYAAAQRAPEPVSNPF